MVRHFLKFLIGGLALLNPHFSNGNDLRLSNLAVVDSQHVQVTVQWSHSWNLQKVKEPYNHDAVWLFLKHKAPGDNHWQHTPIHSEAINHEVKKGEPGLVRLDGVEDEAGLWVKRQKKGGGSVAPQTLKIRLASAFTKGDYQFRAYGIEMVHVKRDSFYLGDGISNNSLQAANDGKPYLINHSGRIPVDSQGQNLNATGDYAPGRDIPFDYPLGYEAFYAMKYEISQAQYVGFLNSLSKAQQMQRIGVDPESSKGTLAFPRARSNRNGIVIQKPAKGQQPAVFACDANPQSPVGAEDDGQNRSCNLLKWADVAAYLDWGGLAPMTETAFEKLCRGPEKPVKLDFAWGTAKVTDANSIVKDGTPWESVNESLPARHGLASHGYSGPKGPLRNGFGGTDSSSRLAIGAGYYGALELSGNLWELVVNLNKNGLQYRGKPGDGDLTPKGDANEPNWPAPKGQGAGYKGGAWNSGILQEFRDLAVADRFYIYDKPERRRGTNGGRGCRYPGSN